MNDCIFCKIIAGDIPSFKVYENDFVLAFLDIAPVSRGHILVIPKKHFSNFEEINNDYLNQVFEAVKKIALILKKKLKISGYNISVNNDPVAGQIIPHFHVHIIPREKNDGLKLWPGGEYPKNEAEKISKIIKNSL